MLDLFSLPDPETMAMNPADPVTGGLSIWKSIWLRGTRERALRLLPAGSLHGLVRPIRHGLVDYDAAEIRPVEAIEADSAWVWSMDPVHFSRPGARQSAPAIAKQFFVVAGRVRGESAMAFFPLRVPVTLRSSAGDSGWHAMVTANPEIWNREGRSVLAIVLVPASARGLWSLWLAGSSPGLGAGDARAALAGD